MIKHSRHLRTPKKCRKHLRAVHVVYISFLFSKAFPQSKTWLRLIYLSNRCQLELQSMYVLDVVLPAQTLVLLLRRKYFHLFYAVFVRNYTLFRSRKTAEDTCITLHSLGDSRKYPYHTTDGFSEFRVQGGVV